MVIKERRGQKVEKASQNEVAPQTGDLTCKQRMFVDSYLSNGFNATEAARAAGYRGKDDHSLASIGYENLRKPEISAAVQQRMNEAAMSANEVLARLSKIARGEVVDFLDEDGKFDLRTARRLQKAGLLKKLKSKRTSKNVDTLTEGEEDSRETLETSLVYEEVEFEMYSAHEALRDLGKYHKLFTDKHEIGGVGGGPVQIEVEFINEQPAET
jgi:hypothetical protein